MPVLRRIKRLFVRTAGHERKEPMRNAAGALSREELKTEPVIVAACPDESEQCTLHAIDECIRNMGGLDWVKPGMKIAVKANMVASASPEKGVTTSPALLRALCTRLTQRGARVVIGDSPGGLYTSAYVNAIYRGCHMQEALIPGVTLNDDFSIRKAVFNEACSIKTFQYTSWLDQADAIINFAKLKTHGMMAMSCSVKNLFGTIPGTVKPEYHMRFPDTMAFANMLVDLNLYFKPVFHFVDGIIAMEGNGPTAGTARHMGVVLASRSPFNLDMVCANLIGLKNPDVPTIVAACHRGLGAESLDQITLFGSLDPFRKKDFKLVTRRVSVTFGTSGLKGKMFSKAARWVMASRPMPVKTRCVGCGRCASICPAKAITMIKKKPGIDRTKCIRCFCCQEFCPEGAMVVWHNPIGLLISGINTLGDKKNGEQ